MAEIGSIDWQTDTETFLKAEQVSELSTNLSKAENMGDTENSILQPVTQQMGEGLSLEALNIDGRAPLNEMAEELQKKITTTILDIEMLPSMAEADGNKHRQQEANEYYIDVMDRKKQLEVPLIEAVNAYNSNLEYKVFSTQSVTGEDENVKEDPISISCFYSRASYSWPDGGIPIVTGLDDRSSYAGAVQSALNECLSFNEKVVKAKELKTECDGLNTSPDRTQSSHQRDEHSSYSNGSYKDEHVNADGSKVVVQYNKDGKKVTETHYDKNGNLIETTAYNTDGSINHKEVVSGGQMTTFKPNEEGILVATATFAVAPGAIAVSKGDELNINGENYTFYASYIEDDGTKIDYYSNANGEVYYFNEYTGQMTRARVKQGHYYDEQDATTKRLDETRAYNLMTPEGTIISRNDLSYSANVNTTVTKGNYTINSYTTPTSFDEVNQAMANKEPIRLTPGSSLTYDQPGIWNNLEDQGRVYFGNREEDTYLVYGGDGNYYEGDVNGKITGTTPINIEEYSHGKNNRTEFNANTSSFSYKPEE